MTHLLLAALSLGWTAVVAADPPTAQMSCSEVSSLRLPDVRISAAEPVTTSGNDKPHCRVAGVIGKEIRFELLLPDDWNGRFFMGGGGGYVGAVTNSARSTVNKGYATSGTDTGHRANTLEAGWALNDAERQLNFGHLAIHRTAEVSKAIVRAYYGAHPEYSYFSGCSRGGGQALMEAQRYPQDFDGIVSAAPAFDWTGFMAAMIQNVQLNYPDPSKLDVAVISTANLELLESSVLEACDDLDGVKDGVMEDPRQCDFDLASIPSCPAGPGNDCFTAPQRAAIERIYSPAVVESAQVHPGWTFGGENAGAGWKTWIAGPNRGFPNLHFAFGTQFFKYFVYGDPDWDYSTYDFVTWEKDSRFAGSFLDAIDPDLGGFEDRGGKLILWHGWSDPALTALRTIDYYEEVQRGDPAARDYVRLFMLPGVLHCAGGPGPDRVDWVDVIADWVENGNAPDHLVASKIQGREVVRTRPLCPYPERAVYRGTGNTDDAASFDCREAVESPLRPRTEGAQR